MPPSIAMCCKMCWRGWTRPIKPSSAVVQRGRRRAGFPRFKGRNRYHSFTFKEYGNGATLDNGTLVLSKIGRIKVQWSRPMEGTAKTITISKEADGWYMADLLCWGAHATLTVYWPGDWHRPRSGILCHAREWRAHPDARLLPQGRAW